MPRSSENGSQRPLRKAHIHLCSLFEPGFNLSSTLIPIYDRTREANCGGGGGVELCMLSSFHGSADIG